MHSLICEFPSKTLYQSKLESDASAAGRLLADLPNARADSEDDRKELLETPVVFFDTAGCEYFERVEGDGDEGSRCNENEATIVKNWVDKLVSIHGPLEWEHFYKMLAGFRRCFSGPNIRYHTVSYIIAVVYA